MVTGILMVNMHWKGYNNKEIDFVVHKGMKVLKLINVTFSSSIEDIKEREINSLISGSIELNCNGYNFCTLKDRWQQYFPSIFLYFYRIHLYLSGHCLLHKLFLVQ